jgi:hypothetical protein
MTEQQLDRELEELAQALLELCGCDPNTEDQ